MNFHPFITHEVPKCFLNWSRKYNDYDYALAHHLEEKDYKKYFIFALQRGRKVILDNSLYELGAAYTNDIYADLISSLHPSEYILPDVFDDFEANIQSQIEFLRKYHLIFLNTFYTKPIGVIHGTNFEELRKAYKQFLQYEVKIAIPFGSKAFEKEDFLQKDSFFENEYEKVLYEKDILFRKSMNRLFFLIYLINSNTLDPTREHHLLGNYYLKELSLYSSIKDYSFSFISTIDTSHPIAAAIEEKDYYQLPYFGLYYKPQVTIESVFYQPLELTFFYNKNIFYVRGLIKRQWLK